VTISQVVWLIGCRQALASQKSISSKIKKFFTEKGKQSWLLLDAANKRSKISQLSKIQPVGLGRIKEPAPRFGLVPSSPARARVTHAIHL
jgi:hypothetical protein